MRKRKLLRGRPAPELLFGAAIYVVIFGVGWVLAKGHFSPVQAIFADAPAGTAPSAATASAQAGKYTVGKLLIMQPGRCQYGEFSNVAGGSFELKAADCDRISHSAEPTKSAHTSRVEAIGKYFRGGQP